MAESKATATKVRAREYETLFLVKQEATDEAVDRIKERLRGVVTKEGGKVLKFTLWGKKKTAFLVAGQPRANYVHMSYLGNPGLVHEVERNLAILEDVAKFMSKVLAHDIDPETREVLADEKIVSEEDKPVRPERDAEAEFSPAAEDDVGVVDEA